MNFHHPRPLEGSLKYFWYVVETRLKMFHNKMNPESPPYFNLPEWTNIIRIENIFRQTDRTSIFLQDQEEFREDPRSVVKFTLLNSPVSWAKYKTMAPDSLEAFVIELIDHQDQKAFHSAYLTMGSSAACRHSEYVLDDIISKIHFHIKPSDLHSQLINARGIGDFLAHQIIVNLQLTGHIQYDSSYVALGTGSNKGLQFLKLPERLESLDFLFARIPESVRILTPVLSPLGLEKNCRPCIWTTETIENCLCIYQKVFNFELYGKSKRLYSKPNESTLGYVAPKFYMMGE